MLMHHANERVLLAIAPRRQCTTNGATGLSSTPPKACKEDACECAPQAHLIVDAQSMHNRESWQMSNNVLALRAQPHNLKNQQIEAASCQARHHKNRRPALCTWHLALAKFYFCG